MTLKKALSRKILIPALILILSVAAFLYLYIARAAQFKDWVSTTGVILHIEKSEHYGRRLVHEGGFCIYYSYKVNGASYSGLDMYTEGNMTYAEGDPADVWYDPADPFKSSFRKPGQFIDTYAPFIFGIPLAVYAFLRLRRRELKQQGT